jgi:RNA polymerase sigma factor (sigma-70 family)
MSAPRGELTTEQWQEVLKALPEARALARSLARRCTGHTADELATLAEDSLMRRVRHFDPTRGASLFAFARKEVRKDVIRAAYARAEERQVAAGLQAIDTAEEALEVPDLATKFEETPEERLARAHEMGTLMDRAAYAHAASSRTPEEAVGTLESFLWMKQIAADSSEQVETLMELLYEQDSSWEEAAARLQLSVRQAQRLESAAIERLRKAIGARGRAPSNGCQS